ncbi:GmrSD restriction endonuclease domain-containing protein [Dictyobacter arantiisoli]|uniref:GmrSD restriction endonucleases N-terminal domain-containing protein n=1 Tax=Dictyobacter arantiisoli TaxID=2014874 RepID=A0A5A5T609_9CHLR|nr:DUF262 domain-containing protein [Dictyobacter arantiisoli]GCF06469.1 hypothetical protein KDI_00330 [Dictyobacter arantiisoli]
MIQTEYRSIESLIAAIKDEKLVLPELQRQYVWKGRQVRDLFDSLYREYPSGQLLIWDTDEILLSRQAGVNGIYLKQNHAQLLLDGQQRLTSLANIMLGRPLKVRDAQNPIDIAFNVYTGNFKIAPSNYKLQQNWISISDFFVKGAMTTYAHLGLDLKSTEAQNVYDRLNKLDNIKKYQYNVNVLQHMSYQEVTHIFVRTNSGGTKLGNADLALAQVSSYWQGATQLFEEYQHTFIGKQFGFKLDSGLIIRAIVVLLSGQSRFNQLIRGGREQVTIEKLQDAWEKVKKALDRSIDFLVHNCLIDRLEMLSTRTLIIPLIAFFDRYENHASDSMLRDLQRWVYLALIRARYSGSSETALDQDLNALAKEQPVQAMIQNIEDVVGNRPITEREIQGQLKNSPFLLMSYVLARRAHAQDWFNGMAIGNNGQDYQLHHIFPKKLLTKTYKSNDGSKAASQLANLIFVSTTPPNEYLVEAPDSYLLKIDKQRLKAQEIPLDEVLWKLNHFDDFMKQRRTQLANGINQLLLMLSDENTVWADTPVEMLEAQIDHLEYQFRLLIATRLEEEHGEKAWELLKPDDVRKSVEKLITQRKVNKPFEADKFGTLLEKLSFCLFSQYPKIIKENWSLFEDVFQKQLNMEQYTQYVINVRNAIKHGNDINPADLASANAGLLWLNGCLDYAKLREDAEDEDEEEIVSA